MAYAVYSFASQYTDTGQIGVYVGTREDNLADCLEIARRADRRHRRPATCASGELERAKENLKGRILLSMESTSNRMSRLGKSLITDTELLSLDRIIAEIDAVEPSALAELAGGAARAGAALGRRASGRARSASSRRVERVTPALARARREGRALRPRRARSARCSAPALEAAGHDARRARRDGARRWSTSRARTRSSANVRAALEPGVPCVVGTTRLGPGDARRRWRASAVCRSSSRRTSRSAPC